jgi:hypothetical protein
VQLISSDSAVRGHLRAARCGRIASKDFVRELGSGGQTEFAPHRVSERIDDETGRSWSGYGEGRVQSKRTSEQKLCKEGCNFLTTC